MADVKEILDSLGYKLFDSGANYRTRPLYRDSDNNNVLSIKKDTGYWYDFKTSQSGALDKLVALTLGIQNAAAKEWLKEKDWIIDNLILEQGKLDEVKFFDPNELDELVFDPVYWEGRGISGKTVKVFEGGVCRSGKMKDRFVFPIYNSKKKIVGFSGRDLSGVKKSKWKHLGDKSSWVYPLFFNKKYVFDSKQIILIESIGDMLSLWQAGIRNTCVVFGLSASNSVINFMIRAGVTDIVISLNDDSAAQDAGNLAAEQLQHKLRKFFDNKSVRIAFPDKNDFGEMSKEENIQWAKKQNIYRHQG